MPCLILTGYPCSGKTTVAHLIRDVALEHFPDQISSVVMVGDNEDDGDATAASGPRGAQEGYANASAEKAARASLKSEFDRAVNRGGDACAGAERKPATATSKSTLVILDSLNYIKGFRYELYCISKAAQKRHGVVWVVNSLDTALEWNRSRTDAAHKYDDDLLRQLVARYEPPDRRNRWDSPLYEVDVRPRSADSATQRGDRNATDNTRTTSSTSCKPSSSLKQVLGHSVYDMHQLSATIPNADKAPSRQESTSTVAAAPPSGSRATRSTDGGKPKRAVFKRPTQKSAAPPPTPAMCAAALSAAESDASTAMWAAREAEPSSSASGSTQPASETVHPTTATSAESDGTPAEPSRTDSGANRSLEERVIEMLRSFLSDDNQPLQAGTSTTRREASGPDTLNQIDSVTLQVCDALAGPACAAPNGSISLLGQTFVVSAPHGAHPTMSLAELKRLRKQYMQWVATYPPDDVDPTKPSTIVKSFLAYVDAQRR